MSRCHALAANPADASAKAANAAAAPDTSVSTLPGTPGASHSCGVWCEAKAPCNLAELGCTSALPHTVLHAPCIWGPTPAHSASWSKTDLPKTVLWCRTRMQRQKHPLKPRRQILLLPRTLRLPTTPRLLRQARLSASRARTRADGCTSWRCSGDPDVDTSDAVKRRQAGAGASSQAWSAPNVHL